MKGNGGQSSKGTDFARPSAAGSLDVLNQQIQTLKEEGRIQELEKILANVASSLKLPEACLALMVDDAKRQATQMGQQLGQILRREAEAASCAFDFKPPYIMIGAVTIKVREGKNAYEVSVLDGETLSIQTQVSASALAKVALGHIESIESALAKRDVYAETILKVLESHAHIRGSSGGLSPNLMMQLCGFGKDIKRALLSSEAVAYAPISRPAMAFVLKAAQAIISAKGKTLRFVPATQHSTSDPTLYMKVPSSLNPRELISKADPICEVRLEAEERTL